MPASPLTTTFSVQSKSSAGPGLVNIAFVQEGEPVQMGNTTLLQSFNRTLAQEEADLFEINSRWTQTLVAAEPLTAPE